MGAFLHLPDRSDEAAANMALDLLLLSRFPEPDAIRYRSYRWSRPSATFGLSQSWGAVQELFAGSDLDLVRRPTGGGVVDHRQDWTYALVLPGTHSLSLAPALEPYRIVHTCLAQALHALGVGSRLQDASANLPSLPLARCFVQPSPFDVLTLDGRKIAGAALKRTRHGLLLQGSIDRTALPADFAWAAWAELFPRALAVRWSLTPRPCQIPAELLTIWPAQTDEFASVGWNQRRR